jgi:hypothetical protein
MSLVKGIRMLGNGATGHMLIPRSEMSTKELQVGVA